MTEAERERGRNRDENRQRELQHMCCAGILCWGVDMSPGISSAHAQVSLSDLYKHPHSTAGHTHTKPSPLHLRAHKHFSWGSKINTVDNRLTRHMHAARSAKCDLTCTLFIKLRTPHMCEPLWSEIENWTCIFHGRCFCPFWPQPRQNMSFRRKRVRTELAEHVFECLHSGKIEGKIENTDKGRILLSLCLLPLFLSLPTVALKWLG